MKKIIILFLFLFLIAGCEKMLEYSIWGTKWEYKWLPENPTYIQITTISFDKKIFTWTTEMPSLNFNMVSFSGTYIYNHPDIKLITEFHSEDNIIMSDTICGTLSENKMTLKLKNILTGEDSYEVYTKK